MSELPRNLEAFGRDLEAGVRALIARRRRRRRVATITAAIVLAAACFSAVAVASGLVDDLSLNPARWRILDHGDVEGGQASYVRAIDKRSGKQTLFTVVRDRGMDRYRAFLLHEEVAAAAGERSYADGMRLCSRRELTRAEQVAVAHLEVSFTPAVGVDAMKRSSDKALAAAFAARPCRGLDYAGERARFVFAGVEPPTMLMPSVVPLP
jgi:hypothetical protein